MEKILVAGAHGTTGKKIIQILMKSENFEPVAMVRNEEQVDFFKSQHVNTVIGDLEKDISHTVKGIDKVIFAAGSGGKKVVAVDQEGAKKLIDASKETSIKKFVMLSSMGADQPEDADDLKDYLKAKHNADEYLKSSGLRYTIVRPGALTNEGGLNYIKLSTKLDTNGEISRADVAKTLVKSLDDKVAMEVTFEIIKGDTSIEDALDKVS